jgi:hypothetical protein
MATLLVRRSQLNDPSNLEPVSLHRDQNLGYNLVIFQTLHEKRRETLATVNHTHSLGNQVLARLQSISPTEVLDTRETAVRIPEIRLVRSLIHGVSRFLVVLAAP